MARMRLGGSPAMSERVFRREAEAAQVDATRMTVAGAVNKSILSCGVLIAGMVWVWHSVQGEDPAWVMQRLMPYLTVGSIAGLVIALITAFVPKVSPFTTLVYAGVEGLVLGAFSRLLEIHYPGIALQAAAATFGIFGAMLVVYKTGIIKVTDRFRSVVGGAMMAIFIVYLASFLLRMFGIGIPFIHEGGPIGILFSLGVIVVASLMLLVDFDSMEQGERAGAPKYMEWYCTFGLLVTLVWIYVEVLRLLAKLRE